MAGSTIETTVAMPLAQLRREIRELELGAGHMKRRGKGVLALLTLRSHLESSVREHEEAGLDLRPERTRLETVDNILSREAKTVLREAKAAGGMKVAREQTRPAEDHWWWYLDRKVADDRRKQAIKIGSLTSGALVVILVGSLLMDRFFGMDAAEQEARTYVNSGEQLLRAGEYSEAILEYEQAVEVDAELGAGYVALGVLYDLEGRAEESREALATARALVGDEAEYVLTVARTYGDVASSTGADPAAYVSALSYADQAIALAPDSAQAYLIRAGIYESGKQRVEAVADLERSVDLAQAIGEDELYVLAKMRLGMLLQQVPDNAFAPPSDAS